MATFSRLLLVLFALFALSACGPMYETNYSYVPPASASGKACVVQCQQSKQLCKRICNSEENACVKRARQQARFEFKSYKQERKQKGLPIERTQKDFFNPVGCETKSCSCKKDYQACFQMCGGQLVPHRKCVAFCDKK